MFRYNDFNSKRIIWLNSTEYWKEFNYHPNQPGIQLSEDFNPRGGYNGKGEEVATWHEQSVWPPFNNDPTLRGE